MRGVQVYYPTGHQFIHFPGPDYYLIVVKTQGRKGLSPEQGDEFLRENNLAGTWSIQTIEKRLAFAGPESQKDEVLKLLGEFLKSLAVHNSEEEFNIAPLPA